MVMTTMLWLLTIFLRWMSWWLERVLMFSTRDKTTFCVTSIDNVYVSFSSSFDPSCCVFHTKQTFKHWIFIKIESYLWTSCKKDRKFVFVKKAASNSGRMWAKWKWHKLPIRSLHHIVVSRRSCSVTSAIFITEVTQTESITSGHICTI
jgi:hypothetical protein